MGERLVAERRVAAAGLLIEEPSTTALDAAQADYAAGLAGRDAGDYALAASRFAAAVGDGGPLVPMARLREAQMLVAAKQRVGAASVFAAVLAENALPTSLAPIAITEAASNLDALGRSTDAILVLSRMASLPGADVDTRAEARWQIAVLRRAASDAGWVDDARAALDLSTAFGGATAALDSLEATNVVVPPLTAALVDYRAFRNAAAGQRLSRALIDPTHPLSMADAATAWFYLAALQERVGTPDAALTDYALSASLNPGGPLADDSLYWRARIFADRGDLMSEISEFDRLAQIYPNSSFAAAARLTPAVELGRSGHVAEALTRLEAIASSPSSNEAATAARWHQVFREGASAVQSTALSAATYDPASFGAILERTGVDPELPLPSAALGERPSGVATTAGEAATLGTWMATTFGPQPQTSLADSAEPVRRLGFALFAAGDIAVGRTLLSAAITDRADRPYDLLDIANAAAAAGVYDIEVGAASALLSTLTGAQRIQAPFAILRLAYPAPYLPETLTAAQQANVPPLLMFALVRQESAFNPSAGSPAGAHGLAQFIPSTAIQVMQTLGITVPVQQALSDPEISLRLGARYLADQLKAFDGNTIAALAAYNAGGGNARRWLDAQVPKNTDGYRWTVDFGETQRYLDHVLVNYAWYRYIYGGASLAIVGNNASIPTPTPTSVPRPIPVTTGAFLEPPVFSAGGTALVVFGGGTVVQLEAATTAAKGKGVWAQDTTGAFQLLVSGGPGFLNDGFGAAFPVGFIGITAVTAVR